jgi:hypothetical protein
LQAVDMVDTFAATGAGIIAEQWQTDEPGMSLSDECRRNHQRYVAVFA